MKLEDAIKDAFSESANAREKQMEKRFRNKNPMWVRDFIFEYCSNEDIPCDKSSWDKKLVGQAKWWLAYCHSDCEDPRARIQSICNRWGEIVTFFKKKNWPVSRGVSFRDYISRWRMINDLLDGYLDNKSPVMVDIENDFEADNGEDDSTDIFIKPEEGMLDD